MNVRASIMTARRLWRTVAALRAHTSGAIAIEYGLIAALVTIAILGVLRELGGSLVGLPMAQIVAALANAAS